MSERLATELRDDAAVEREPLLLAAEAFNGPAGTRHASVWKLHAGLLIPDGVTPWTAEELAAHEEQARADWFTLSDEEAAHEVRELLDAEYRRISWGVRPHEPNPRMHYPGREVRGDGWRGACQCGWLGPERQAARTADADCDRHRARYPHGTVFVCGTCDGSGIKPGSLIPPGHGSGFNSIDPDPLDRGSYVHCEDCTTPVHWPPRGGADAG